MSTGRKQKFRKIPAAIKRRLGLGRPKRVLFDHIPKCGGSTVTRYLYEQYRPREIFQLDGRHPEQSANRFRALPEKDRHQYRLIVGHSAHRLIESANPDCIRLAILRDPVDRVISHYYYVLRDKGHYLRPTVLRENMDLKTYVSQGYSELNNWYTAHYSGLDRNRIEQEPEFAQELAFLAIAGWYDLVGTLSDLPELMKRLEREAEFRTSYIDNQFNKTDNRPSVNSVAPDVIDLVRENNRLDCQLFDRVKHHFGLS